MSEQVQQRRQPLAETLSQRLQATEDARPPNAPCVQRRAEHFRERSEFAAVARVRCNARLGDGLTKPS